MCAVSAKWAASIGGLAALGAVVLLSGPSDARDDRGPATPKPATRCLGYPLENTEVVDSETLFVQDQSGHAALIKMKGACLEPNEAIGLKYYGSNQICGPLDVEISGSVMTGIPRLCMIDTITPLSKDEAKAYLHGK